MDSLWNLLSATVGGIIVYLANRQLNKANALSVTADTMTKMAERIYKLEQRDEANELRIDKLEKEVRKWKRGYSKAINHIYKIAPEDPIPDFLQDTDELMKGKK